MSERDKRRWQKIKSDPIGYAAYLERKRRERAAKVPYETNRKRKWRLANPEAADRVRRANHAVEYEIEAGGMVRPEACSRCGNLGPVDGHHPSYEKSQWLVVIWLCKKCHASEHS